MQVQDSRRLAWKPSARPEWVSQVNAEVLALDLPEIVPLHAESLIDSAVRLAGLSDFGSDDWRAPFDVLVRALDEEAGLNLMGRILTRTDLLNFLVARLKVEEAYRLHPEIEDEEIAQPLLIIGQGRSGTSFLLNLLSEDPDNRTVRTWEAMFPAPPLLSDDAERGRRIAKAQAITGLANRVTPELLAAHEFSADVATESINLFALAFVGDWIPGLLGQVPTFQAFAAPRIAQGILYERRVLKLLQWRQPKRRWVLKNPAGLPYLAETLEVYPDMRIAWAHRDPLKALSSVVSLQGTLNWVRSDAPFLPGAHEKFLDSAIMGQALAAPIDLIENGIIPADRFGHVQYPALIADPLETIERLYRDLGFAFTDNARARLATYLAVNPRTARPTHRYGKGDAGDISRDRANFDRYQHYFAVVDEA